MAQGSDKFIEINFKNYLIVQQKKLYFQKYPIQGKNTMFS